MRRYIIICAILAICEILIALYLTHWRNLFWDYVQAKNLHGFIVQIGVFTVAALTFCMCTSVGQYCGTMAAIKWRKHLNDKAVHCESECDNINQRIQDDCNIYPDLWLQLVFGLGKSVIYILLFSVTLCLSFSYLYLIIIVVYASISTVIAKWIASPLIVLNYKVQQAEATYRNHLNKQNFQKCIVLAFGVCKRTKRLSYFQTLYGQIGVILPICIIAPAYFLGAMTLGMLMQGQGVMSTIIENMSFGITSFKQINKLLSCKKRLQEINII